MNIAVIMGGHASEHEVSLNSGQTAIDALKQHGWVSSCVISKNLKTWNIDGNDYSSSEGLLQLKRSAEVCLLMLHGPFGEDGTIQGAFETIGLPYTGSNPRASALANDKLAAGLLFERAGLLTPAFVNFHVDNPAENQQAIEQLTYPMFVKPTLGGSSVATSIVNGWEDLLKASQGHQFSEFLAQKLIKGRELQCGVIDVLNDAEALPVIEIIPPEGRFFDYEAKYTAGVSQEIVPAQVDGSITKAVQEASVKAHELLGCKGITRSDFMVNDEGTWLLEINTAPGMTATSLVPQELAAADYELSEILLKLCEQALAA